MRKAAYLGRTPVFEVIRTTAGLVLLSLLLLLTTSTCSGQENAVAGAAGAKTVVIIPVEGFVDQGLFDSIRRRVEESKALSPELLVFKIDTYGGLAITAMEITDEIGHIEAPLTVAYVPVKAYSAGAMIAMGAKQIVLGPLASIGDAAPVVPTEEGSKILGEKEQSPVRNAFRKYAQENGYSEALSEAMVSPDIEVSEVTFEDGTKKFMTDTELAGLKDAERFKIQSKRVVVAKGRILTMNAKEASEYGFARHIVKDTDELLSAYDLTGATVATLEVSWSESLVRFLNNPAVSGLIMMVGLVALYMEFKVPGFGLPGTVAIICFATFFFSKYLSGMAESWEIIIFIVGVVLLGIEIFVIPGFGITGFAGLVLMFLGLALVIVPNGITTAPVDMDFLLKSATYVVGAMIGAMVSGILLAKLLPKVPVVGLFYLGVPKPEAIAHREAAGVTSGKNLVGKRGTAMTMLRPAGRAVIDGEIFDVTTEGDLVAKDNRIEVIAQKGNNIVVRETRQA